MKMANCRALLVGGSFFVGGVLLGLAVGAISGILFAPRSGEDTRELLCKHAEELGATIKGKGQQLFDAGKRQLCTSSLPACEAAEHGE